VSETQIMRIVKHHLNLTGRCRLVRQNVGFDKEKQVKYGYAGQPDLIGVLRGGVCFCLEIKAPGGRVRPEQKAWWRSAYQWGVRGGVCRSLDGAMRALEAAEKQYALYEGEVIDFE
jgi:hypothetical protein